MFPSLASLTAAALTPRFLQEADFIGRQFGPQAGLDFFFWRITPPGIGQFLIQNGLGNVAMLRAASAGDVNRIIRDPWILQATRSNRDAIFLFGPGFTPDIFDAVVAQINRFPGTRGSRIDLVNTGRLAQLSPQFLFILQAITNPGQAGALALGVSPQATFLDVANLAIQQLSPGLPAGLFAQSAGANAAVQRLFGGPIT
jgi:hypothetical protein